MDAPAKMIAAIAEKWDELDNKFIAGPLSTPEELFRLMHQYRFAQALRFDRNLDSNYLPRQISVARLHCHISPPRNLTLADYCMYHGKSYPMDLRKVAGLWHSNLPFTFPNIVILDICLGEATYWLPSILEAITSVLKRIILRDGGDIIDSTRVYDFPVGKLYQYLQEHPETSLLLPFVSSDERAIWVNELFFVFKQGRVAFLSRDGE